MKSRGEIFGGLMFLGVLVLLGVWISTGRQVPLDRSITGFSGLANWLKSQQIVTSKYKGGQLDLNDIGLRVLPLFDTDFIRKSRPAKTNEEYLASGDEREISRIVAHRKAANVVTLVIAPKWQRAARLSGYVHESVRLPLVDTARPLKQFAVSHGSFARPSRRLAQFETVAGTTAGLPGGLTVTLYAPQVFDFVAEKCTGLIGNDIDGYILIECPFKTGRIFMLSDPDMLNNHGLSLGNNADTAAAVLKALSGGGRILLDQSTFEPAKIWSTTYERTWADILVIFKYPFALIWGGFAALMIALLWRGGRRTSAPRQVFDDQIGASKRTALDAKARLFRLSGHDSELMEAHVTERCNLVATRILGPHRGSENAMVALLRILNRKNPALARTFEAAHGAALAPPTGASSQDMLARLSAFETQLDQVKHEFGRA